MTRLSLSLTGLLLLLLSGTASAQVVPPLAEYRDGQMMRSFALKDAPLNLIMDEYSLITGRILLYDPGVPQAQFTLQSKQRLTAEEALVAIETLLAMNQIGLVEWGDRFVKVVPIATVQQQGQEVQVDVPDEAFALNDQMVSQVFELKYLEINEVQPIVQQLLHSYGKIHPLERINAILVTDTTANLKQVVKLLARLDRPIPLRQELKIYQIQYAEASEVAAKLNELVEQALEDQDPNSNNRGNSRRTAAQSATAARIAALRGRNNNTPDAVEASPSITPASGDLGRQGIVQGKVSIVADERSNILLVTSEPANFPFFDDIIKVLDIPIEPETMVKTFLLEFAVAEDAANILNELIGAATESSDEQSDRNNQADGGGPGAARSVADLIRSRQNNAAREAVENNAKASISQLSDSTSILADERTNSLLIMGRKQDIALLEDVIRQLDVMLAQVMIEVVILEVNLSDSLSYGLDWLQRSLTAVGGETLGPGGGLEVTDPVFSFGGASRVNDGGGFIDGATVDRDTSFGSGGLTYYSTIYGLNLDLILRAAAGSSEAEVVQSPVIITTDNTEAKITVAEQRPIPTTSSTTLNGTIRSTFEYRDIGVVLTVTPRINPNKMVTMEVVQSADNVGGDVVIDGNNVPRILKRELEANITVSNRTTIALGGLVSQDDRDSRTKIPILGDIPIIGNLFRSTTKEKARTELLVLITPYVMLSPEEAELETRRLHNAVHLENREWGQGWSASPLVDPAMAREAGTLPVRDRGGDRVIRNALPDPEPDSDVETGPVTGEDDPRSRLFEDQSTHTLRPREDAAALRGDSGSDLLRPAGR